MKNKKKKFFKINEKKNIVLIKTDTINQIKNITQEKKLNLKSQNEFKS